MVIFLELAVLIQAIIIGFLIFKIIDLQQKLRAKQ